VLDSMVSKDRENNNNEVKYGATFYGTKYLTPAVVMFIFVEKSLESLKQQNYTKTANLV
jgi:hypothetical protein